MNKQDIYQSDIIKILSLLSEIEQGKVLMDCGTPYNAGTWFWADDYKPRNSIMNALPSNCTTLRGRAIMKKLDTTGLICGCHCGCRGSYTLSLLGKQIIFNNKQLPCLH